VGGRTRVLTTLKKADNFRCTGPAPRRASLEKSVMLNVSNVIKARVPGGQESVSSRQDGLCGGQWSVLARQARSRDRSTVWTKIGRTDGAESGVEAMNAVLLIDRRLWRRICRQHLFTPSSCPLLRLWRSNYSDSKCTSLSQRDSSKVNDNRGSSWQNYLHNLQQMSHVGCTECGYKTKYTTTTATDFRKWQCVKSKSSKNIDSYCLWLSPRF